MRSTAPRMRTNEGFRRVSLVLFWSLLASSACQTPPDSLRSGPSIADDASITYENLDEHEQSWPYRVKLVDSWKPAGWKGRFGWGVGILVRVEANEQLRIDFAGLGKYQVPARATNVIAEANRIRRGELSKTGPNFINAVGTRILDLSSSPIRPVATAKLNEADSFLVVFADPTSKPFREMTAELEAMKGSPGTTIILFPQGGHRDGSTLNACRDVGWTELVLFDRFVEPLTGSYLGEAPASPHAMLLSPEGRLIVSGNWNARTREDLRSAMATLRRLCDGNCQSMMVK